MFTDRFLPEVMTVSRSESQPKFKTREEVDFVIVGSGTAGGVLARELSTNGFSVVVLEQAHLLGTCRMGNDPATSVVDKYHRAHDVPNLFICDGSSFVSSGRGQPTMTIQALAFRAAEHITRFARNGEI